VGFASPQTSPTSRRGRGDDGCPTGAGRRRREGRCNTRSSFETSRYNTCSIRLKIDETLAKTPEKHLKPL